jgi:hypothetical protein
MEELRTVLVAGDNEIWTNGKIFGKTIYLAVGMNPDDFYIISQAEYEEYEKEKESAE